MINARAEGIAAKPAFRAAFKARRCLVPADGSYEWQKVEGGTQPMLIRLRLSELFAFAGLWETWCGPEGAVETCTISLGPGPCPLQRILGKAGRVRGSWAMAEGRNGMPSAIQPHNERAAATWGAGGADYDAISRTIADSIEHCMRRLGPGPGGAGA